MIVNHGKAILREMREKKDVRASFADVLAVFGLGVVFGITLMCLLVLLS